MKIELRHCTIVFDCLTSPYEKIIVSINRPGKPTVTFEKEDFAEILNALIASQQVINSTETIRFYNYNINPCYHKPTEIEIFLLATKINHEVKMSIMGFEHYSSSIPQKIYTIYIDKEDDIFKLSGEYLRYISSHGDYRGRIAID